ncbi:hypothetical protein H0A36_14440 [Endozoicomonas sp. SM1973]|uniref:Uncharacterized protein n=1 Tax=Spartinivicinus marinus TaxID=2994442 RepID=A0A853I1D2_9GAMM|nr:hypothetical protein [Spartinivicinus marinus]MCX4028546.1 hypothetical protein [Spartinivicinus marinus]NYZ67213.1 hypothetical protein [Spartinivicinus marinus]
MNNSQSVFGNEIELDGVLYVSVNFLKQYPEYLDNEFNNAVDVANDRVVDIEDGMPEEGDDSPSVHKSEVVLNGTTYLAAPILRTNPNYVELKYNQQVEVALPQFIPNNVLDESKAAISFYRRRSI